MNVSNALGFPSPIAPPKRSDAPKEADAKEAPLRTRNPAEFAAFLSMIVGNDPKLRSELEKQLPEHSAGLLDHLLSSADDAQSELADAVDAARYGMIPETPRDSAPLEQAVVATVVPDGSPAAIGAATTAAPAEKAAEPALTRGQINKINRTLAAEVLSSLQNGEASVFDNNGISEAKPGASTTQQRIPQSVLALVTARKSPALEQLLAVGDREAASVRVGLDNVLAKSGTEEGLKLAANHAASLAMSAALAASAADVSMPVKDIEGLDPELRNRLERVIDRMKTEFGHDVSVVETVRSQDRQNSLYAQGRTTPGPVVTWTEDSLHTQGKAVDVIVDGTWNNAKGFARLQQIAKEEGLNVLGMKDPGHLELPKDSWSSSADVRVMSASNSGPVSNGIARVATVARIAQVGVGVNAAPLQPEMPAVPQPVIQTNGASGLLPQRDQNSGSNAQTSSDSASEQPAKKSSLKSTEKTEARSPSHAYQETPSDLKSKFIGPVDETQRPSGAAEAVDRIQNINDLREQQAAKPLSQMTLEVDDIDGTKQQITVDVRGNTVGTHISANRLSADRMRANVGELKTGLESRGLEADSVRISTQGARGTDTIDGAKQTSGIERDALRMTGAGNSGSMNSDQSAQQGARERSSAARDWEDKQAARDEQRAQNRDAQGRGSGNQDRQRPQYQEKK